MPRNKPATIKKYLLRDISIYGGLTFGAQIPSRFFTSPRGISGPGYFSQKRKSGKSENLRTRSGLDVIGPTYAAVLSDFFISKGLPTAICLDFMPKMVAISSYKFSPPAVVPVLGRGAVPQAGASQSLFSDLLAQSQSH